eukprot:GILK01003314.1.p1 GENE.GILK01003314.1~~GILK01003314.1.p1  ORF type:complete len:449 (-),score=49.27 GILK01003314.1:295-1599(-)
MATVENGESSWGASIRAYRNNKLNLGYVITTPTYITEKEVKQRDRVYDPILQQFRDSQREAQRRAAETETKNKSYNHSKDYALRFEQTHDIITHQTKLHGLEQHSSTLSTINKHKTHESPIRCFNIISNKNFTEHHYDSPENRPMLAEKKGKQNMKNKLGIRHFDIINNKHHSSSDEQAEEQHQIQATEESLERWRKSTYDPIQNRYCDTEKENSFWKSVETVNEYKARKQKESCPPAIKLSEGALYNPVNMEIKDERGFQYVEHRDKGRKERYRLRYDKEEEFHSRDVETSEKLLNRSLNRLSAAQFAEEISRGYDIVSGAPFHGLQAVKKHYPVKTPASVWESLIRSSVADPGTEAKRPRTVSHSQLPPLRSESRSLSDASDKPRSAVPSLNLTPLSEPQVLVAHSNSRSGSRSGSARKTTVKTGGFTRVDS